MAFDITGQLNLRLANGAIRNVANEINAGLRSSGIGAVNIPIKADQNVIKSVSTQFDQATNSVLKFAQQSGLALKRFAAFSLAAGPIIALGSAMRQSASEAMAFDKEMVRLRQVSMDVSGEVKVIAAEVTRLSTNLGVSSQDLIKTAVTLKQANLSIAETKEALEALAKSALAPNFDSMAQTTEGAIAVMNQFKIESKDLEQALGSMNAVAGEFAVEAGDLIEVVRRTGGAFKATGGDLNELMAVFTSVRQTTRESAESIATGLRTIFTRLQRNETVAQLKDIGVNLRYTRQEAEQMGNIKMTDQFVGAYEAVRRLSTALAQIPESDARFASITEELGGYRQIGKVIPMLKEFAVSERALMVAEAGRISLQVNAAQATESYSNRLMRLKENYMSFGRTLMDTGSFKSAFDSFEMLASSFLKVMEVARPLLPLLSALASVKFATSFFPFAKEMAYGATYSTHSFDKGALGAKKKMAEGGLVPGTGNTDSVPVNLRPGSFVVRKSSVAKYGKDALEQLAKGYANGGQVSAMVMPGEYIFSPRQTARIGSSTLSAINQGSLDKFADGTPSGIGNFLKKMFKLDDDSKARRMMASLSPGDSMKTVADVNKDPKVRSLLNRLEKEAIKKHGLEEMMGVLPTIKGSRTIAVPDTIKARGYVHGASRNNRLALTDRLFENYGPNQQVNTLGHEMIHLIDRQAGLRLPGEKKGNIRRRFLSNNPKTETNKIAQELAPFVERAVKKGYLPNVFDTMEEAKEYFTSPEEILAHSMTGGKIGKSLFTQRVVSSLPRKQRKEYLEKTKLLEETFRKEVASVLGDTGPSIWQQKPPAPTGPLPAPPAPTGPLPVPPAPRPSSPPPPSPTSSGSGSNRPPGKPPIAPPLPAPMPQPPDDGKNNKIPTKIPLPVIQGPNPAQTPTAPMSFEDWMKSYTGQPIRDSLLKNAAQDWDFGKDISRNTNIKTYTKNLDANKAFKIHESYRKKAAKYELLSLDSDKVNYDPKFDKILNRFQKMYGFHPREIFTEAGYVQGFQEQQSSLPGPTPVQTGPTTPLPGPTPVQIPPPPVQTTPPVQTQPPKGRPPVGKAIQALAAQYGVDLNTIIGTGQKGAILMADVYAAAGVTPPPKGPRKRPTKTPAPVTPPVPLFDRANAIGITTPQPSSFTSRLPFAGINDPSTAMVREKLSGQDTINLLSEMAKAPQGGAALEKNIFRQMIANQPGLSAVDAQILAASKTKKILSSADAMRSAQETVEVQGGIKSQAASRISDIKSLTLYANRVNNLEKRAGYDPAVKQQRDEILQRMETVKQRVAKNEGFDPNAIYNINNGQYKISDTVKPLLQDLNRELISIGRAAAENISEANKVIAQEKKKLDGVRATMTKDASGRYGVNFSGIPVDKDPASPLGMISPVTNLIGMPSDSYKDKLRNISKRKKEVGFGASVTQELNQDQFIDLLSQMSRGKNSRRILEKSIAEGLQSTRPDLSRISRGVLAKYEARDIFRKANEVEDLKNRSASFQNQQEQYSLRSDAIKNLPAIVDKVNALKELAKLDPTVAPEAKKAMDQLKVTVKTISEGTGLQAKQFLAGEGGKFIVRDAAKDTLARGQSANQLMAQSAAEQAKLASDEAKKKAKQFEGMKASFVKDDMGVEGLKFGGDAGKYGVGPLEAPPGGPGRLTLAQLRQQRIQEGMNKLDPKGAGKGLSEVTKAAVIEEETNKLRREYADGMAQIIMKLRGIASLEAARAIAIEEFNKNLKNHTTVVAKDRTVVNANVARQSSKPPAGTYGDLVNQEFEKIMKKKDPKGKGVSELSRQKAMEEAELNIKNQYLQTVSRQVQKDRKLSDITDALIIAEEMRVKAVDENTQIVRKGNKVFDKSLYDAGQKGGFSLRGVVEKGKENLKEALTSKAFWGGIASIGGSYVGDYLTQSAGSGERAVEGGNEATFQTMKGAGGLLTGAAAGAGAGAMLGMSLGGPFAPILAGVGAAGGAITGFAISVKEASNEISDAKIGLSIKKLDDYLRNFAKGTALLDVDYLRRQQNTTDVEQARKADRNLSTLGMGLYSQESFIGELTKIRRESAAQLVPARMDALTKIIEDRAKKEIGNNANQNEESRRKAFNDLMMENGGFGQSQLGQIASITEQDVNLLRKKMLDMFKRIADTEAVRVKQEQSTTKINESSVLFGNLNLALEISTQKLSEMSVASKNVSDLLDSTFTPYSGSGLASSLQRPFGAGREDYMGALRSVTSMSGGGEDVVKQADVATMAGTVLPSIIASIRSQPVANLARGENFGIQVGDTLRKSLSDKGLDKDFSASIVNLVQSQLGEEDFSKVLRESGQDMSKLVDTLLKPVIEPLTRNSEKMSKLMDDRAKDFADRIGDIARRTRQKGEMIDAANNAEIAAVRNSVQTAVKRKQMPEFAGDNTVFELGLRQQQLRQARLTGFGNGNVFPKQQAVADAQNPDRIFDALQKVIGQVKTAEVNVDRLSKGNDVKASNTAVTELVNLKSRAADLNQALKNLTDTSERNAAAQERLGKIQAEREGRQSLGLRYATSNIEGRAEIARAFRLLEGAARMGTAAPFTVRDQNQIFSLLSSLSPQMRLQGLGGASVKDITSQLLGTTFGGAFDLDPQTAAMERALDNFVQQNYEVASRAAQLQVDNQTNLMGELFSRLESSQTKFLDNLAKINNENSELLKQTLLLRASEKVGKLEKGVGDLSMLGNIDIKNNDEFQALKSMVKDPKIGGNLKTIITQGNKLGGIESLIKETTSPDVISNIVERLNKNIGEQKLSDAGNEETAGSILTAFEEIGLPKELRNNALKDFISSASTRGGTFGGNADTVGKILTSSIQNALGDEARRSRSKIDEAQRKILAVPGNKIKESTLTEIGNQSQRTFNQINFTDLETAIKAVENFGGNLDEVNKQLEKAKEELKRLANPEAKALGGPIRFFNKGGWGSGGSTTPHSSDTVNARINPNEFVVAAGPAQKNKALLEKLNAGGMIHMADGGPIDEIYNNIDIAKGVLGQSGKIIGNEKALEEARRLARVNSAALFLAQLKDTPKEQREKLINDQINALKNGPTNPFQEGILDALNKVKEKREEQKQNEAQLKKFEEDKNAPAFPELLPVAGEFHKALRGMALAHGIANVKTRVRDLEIVVPEIEAMPQVLGGRYDAYKQKHDENDLTFFKGSSEYLSALIDNDEKLKKYKELKDFKEFSKNIPLSILKEFESLEKKREINEFMIDPEAPEPIMTIERLRQDNVVRLMRKDGKYRDVKQILKDFYSNDVSGYFERNVWENGLTALDKPSSKDFVADVSSVLKDMRNKKIEAPKAFDYEASIKALIEEQINTAKNEKDKVLEMIKGKEAVEADIKKRGEVFATPQAKLNKVVGDADPMQVGQKAMQEIMSAQILAREADLFSQLNPALQAKYLEPLKASIRKDGLTAKQQEKLGVGFNGLDKANLTADEIATFAKDKAKMSVLQRAYLEVLMEKAVGEKNPDELNQAERFAYLLSLESKAKTKAYEQVQDNKNRFALNRMGQFLSANPGLINARMAAAEEKGAEAYANEAALLEMVMSYFGTSTKIPSVFAVFKDKKNLVGGKPVEAPKIERPKFFGANEAGDMGGGKANGGLIKFASGGLVPGVGNTDSVRANLPVGSYVIRKSSVNKLGADTLASLPHMATGGVVPAMVMPGEHIFTPGEASKIGKGKLDYINQNGRLPGYFWGGNVPGGNPGGQKVNAQGAGVFGAGVPNQNGQWVFVPKGANPWGANMPFNQGAMQNPAMPFGANANAGGIPIQAGQQNQAAIEKELQQAMAAGNIDRNKLVSKKAEYFQLRRKLINSRIRSKEDVARFRELHAELTNPFVVQADAAQRMLSAQEALAKFQQSPKDFLEAAKDLRRMMLDSKASYEDRLYAKERYEEYVLAARSIPPQVLRAAMVGDKKTANNEIIEREWAERREAVREHNDRVNEDVIKNGPEAVAAHNEAMKKKYGEKLSGPEAVAAHNAKMKEKYGKKISGPEAVKAHNAKVREAEKARLEAIKKNRHEPKKESELTAVDKAIREQRKLEYEKEKQNQGPDVKYSWLPNYKGPELHRVHAERQYAKDGDEVRVDLTGYNKLLQSRFDDKIIDEPGISDKEKFIREYLASNAGFQSKDPVRKSKFAMGMPTQIDKEIRRQKELIEAQKPGLTGADRAIAEERARKEAELQKAQDQGGTEIDKAIRAARMKQNAEANLTKKAVGGIVPGVGSGDTVPALLEPGELVVPKKQVQKFANGGVVGGLQGFANGGMAQGGPDLLDVAAKFNQAATQISQGLSGFSTSVSTFNGAVANFGTFVDKFDEAVGKIPGQIELSGANDISVNLMGQDSIVKAVTEAIGPMIAQAIRDNQPVEQRAQ